MNPALLKAFELGLTAMQFSLERQAKMREQVAAIPPTATPEEIDQAFERISAEALAESQASIDKARAS